MPRKSEEDRVVTASRWLLLMEMMLVRAWKWFEGPQGEYRSSAIIHDVLPRGVGLSLLDCFTT